MSYRGRTFPLYNSSRTFPLAGLILSGTYTVGDAFTYCLPFVANMPVENKISAADLINSIIWNCYPWRWAITPFTAIDLVDGTQDYAFGPSDYFRLVAARLTRTDSTPDTSDELTIVRFLSPDLTKGSYMAGLKMIAYMQSAGSLRLNSAAAIGSGTTIQIDGEYQYQPAALIGADSLFPFPDQYFMVFCSGLLWQFFLYAKDPRAGNAVARKDGSVAYTGQMGIFFDQLIAMREAESWGAGDTVFPSDPLGLAQSRATYGLFNR